MTCRLGVLPPSVSFVKLDRDSGYGDSSSAHVLLYAGAQHGP
jgi:hypothetical protein